MKRRLLTTAGLMLWTLVFAVCTMAQTVTVLDNTAGGLWDALEAQGITDFTTVKNLTVTGEMGGNDFLLVKNTMTNLETLDISGTNIKEIPSKAFANKETLKTVRLPEGITYIRFEAFSYCQQLESVTFGSQTVVAGKIVFPSSLRYIDYNAFYNCSSLTHLNLSACTVLEYISSSAFHNLYNLKEVLFPNQGNIRLEWSCFNVDQIWDEATQQSVYKGLENLTLTKAVTYLSGRCLPRTLKTLSVESSTPAECQEEAFNSILEADNISLKVYIPKGSKRSYAVANGWSSLYQYMQEMGIQINISGFGSLQQGSRTYTNGDVLFNTQGSATTMKAVPDKDNEVISVKLNDNAVAVAADGTFTIPTGTLVGTLSVEFTSNMLTINNPNGGELKELITALGTNPRTIRTLKVTGKMTTKDWNYVKNNMPILEEFDISETDVKTIPEQAMQEHQKITTIHLPSTATIIGTSAFNNCPQLTTVDGCEHVKEILNGAFNSCVKLSNFPFGNELQTIDNCFNNCTSLPAKLTLPASVYSIGWSGTFSGSSIREFDLSQCHLTASISQWMFGAATSVLLPEYGNYGVDLRTFENSYITELSIPSCVSYIGEYAVTSLMERIYAQSATPIQANSNAFTNVDPNLCILYVPIGSKNAYAEATGWSIFTNIKEFGMQVTVGEQGKLRVGGQTLMGTSTFFPKENSVTFEIIPNTGYHADAVTVDGVDVEFADNKFTLSGDQLNGKLIVSFAANKFSLQLNISGNGKVKLGSLEYTAASQTLTAEYLETKNFTLEPAEGQVVSSITFNGKESLVQNGGTSYVTPAITENSILDITFGTGGAGGDVVTYTVKTSEGGSVEYNNTTLLPETTIQVPKGQNAVFAMKPDQYCIVEAVKLNGQNVIDQLDADGKLTVSDVQVDATLEVAFRVNNELTVVMEEGANLSNMLTETQKQNVTKLTIKGQIYEQDFFTMRDDMPLLSVIDLWETQVEYIPYKAFCTNDNYENPLGKGTLTSVRLPKTTRTIGNAAFAGCTNLKEVNFVELTNLENLEYHSFQATNLQTIDLSNTKLTEISEAFRKVKNLENIKFPATLTYLGSVFSGSSLTEIDLSNCTNLKTLESTFSECKNLVKVTLPEGLSSINYGTFQYCNSLTTVNFPKSLQNIGNWAFYNTKLQKIDLSGLTDLRLIGEYAFSNCEELTEVLFPISLEQLGNRVFSNCRKLMAIDLSKTQLTAVSEGIFESCEMLESFKLPKTVETIDGYAFAWNNKLAGILELGPKFKSMGENAFSGTQISIVKCEATTPPTLKSNSMPEVWETAFVPEGYADSYKSAPVWGDKTILDKEVHAEVEVTSAGNLAVDIYEQTGMVPAVITHLKVTGQMGVQDFAILRSNMPLLYNLDMTDAQVNVIPENALLDKKVLMTVKLPASLLRIEQGAFKGCSALRGSLELPTGLKFIGYAAFQGCNSLEEVVLNENLEVIQGYAFEGCSSLAQEITLPINFQSLGERCFANCTSLYGTVKFNRDFYMFMGTEGYGSSAGESFYNCSKIEAVDMSAPDFLDEIPYHTFDGCTSLTTVLLPPELTRIDDSAFANCTSLDGIEFPSSVQVINYGAFQNCSSLTSVDLSECSKLGTIEPYAFSGCSSLENVYLPKSLNWIRDYVFAECRQLTNLHVDALQPADLGEYVFRHVRTDRCVLAIPTGTFYDYMSAAQWGAFVEMRKNIDVTVGEGANLYFMSSDAAAAARSVNRAASVGQQGAKVKDGSSLYVQQNESAVFKLTPDENIEIKKVLYNGEDVTNQLVDGTFTTPNVTAASSFEVQVNVTGDIHVKELRMLDEELAVKIGEPRQLRFAVYPTNATNKNIEWSSSDESVATVNSEGFINGLKAGRAEITAKTVDGGFEEKCQIIVVSNDYRIVMENNVEDFIDNTVYMTLALHNESDARDIQFDVYMPEGITMNDNGGDFGITLSERASRHTVSAARISGEAVRVIVYSIDGVSFENSDGVLLTLPFVTGPEVGNFNVTIKNIHISGPNIADFVASDHTISFSLKDYPLGDSNGSGDITITDAVNTVDHLLQFWTNRFYMRAADVNKDDQITVADVTGTVDLVLERPIGSRAAHVSANDAQGKLYVDDQKMVAGEQNTIGLQIENATDFIAFQCDVYLPEGMTVARDDNEKLLVNLAGSVNSSHVVSANILDNGALRIVVVSSQNEIFRLTNNNIVNLMVTPETSMMDGSMIEIRDIRMVRASDNSEYLAPDVITAVHFGDATGIDAINGIDGSQEGQAFDVFDLRGNKVRSDVTNLSGLSKGVYIVNGKKVIVK